VAHVVKSSSADDLAVLKSKVESLLSARKSAPPAAGMGGSGTTPFDGEQR
jgi:hypothetical protein